MCINDFLVIKITVIVAFVTNAIIMQDKVFKNEPITSGRQPFKKVEGIWSVRPYPIKYFKAVFHKFYLILYAEC